MEKGGAASSSAEAQITKDGNWHRDCALIERNPRAEPKFIQYQLGFPPEEDRRSYFQRTASRIGLERQSGIPLGLQGA